jgi:hypothetical protein
MTLRSDFHFGAQWFIGASCLSRCNAYANAKIVRFSV